MVHWQDTSENGMCAPYAMAVGLCPDIDDPGELTKIARKIQRVVKGKQEPAAWGLSDVIKFSEEYKTSILLVYFARSIDSSSSKIIRQCVGHKPVCVQAQAPPILIAANSEGNHLYGSTIRPKVNWSVIPRISEEVTRPSKNFAGETGSGVSQAQHHPAYSTTKAKSKQQFRADLEHAFTNSRECGILEENILQRIFDRKSSGIPCHLPNKPADESLAVEIIATALEHAEAHPGSRSAALALTLAIASPRLIMQQGHTVAEHADAILDLDAGPLDHYPAGLSTAQPKDPGADYVRRVQRNLDPEKRHGNSTLYALMKSGMTAAPTASAKTEMLHSKYPYKPQGELVNEKDAFIKNIVHPIEEARGVPAAHRTPVDQELNLTPLHIQYNNFVKWARVRNSTTSDVLGWSPNLVMQMHKRQRSLLARLINVMNQAAWPNPHQDHLFTVAFRVMSLFTVPKPDGTPRKLVDTSRINGLGWRARIPLVEGIKNTYQWFLDNEARE